jgi:class 3 adenylate cyclase
MPPFDTAMSETTALALRASQVWVRRTLLCSDVVGYTGLLARLGDRRALHVVRRHDAIVRGCAAAHGGDVLELRGDSFLVAFTRRTDALACAVDIQRQLAHDRAYEPDGGVHIRIGVHTGEFLVERGRYFGLEVVVPFRLCDAAGADQILASGAENERPEANATDCAAAEADTAPGSGPDHATVPVPIVSERVLTLDGIPRLVTAAELDWRTAPAVPASGAAPTPQLAVAGR